MSPLFPRQLILLTTNASAQSRRRIERYQSLLRGWQPNLHPQFTSRDCLELHAPNLYSRRISTSCIRTIKKQHNNWISLNQSKLAMAGATLVGATAVGALSLTRRHGAAGIQRPLVARSFHLSLCQNGLRLPNVVRCVGLGSRLMVRAMAEENSAESNVTTTEDRAMTPEEEEDQANIAEILRVWF